jgi:endoglucanase
MTATRIRHALAGALAVAVLAGCRETYPAGTTTLRPAGPQCPAGDPGQHTPSPPADAAGPHGPAPRPPFLVDPASQAAQQAKVDPSHAASIATLVNTPTALPVGDWTTDVTGQVRHRADAARTNGSTAIFMIYAIPHRDLAVGYSAGGLPNAVAYRAFTRQVAAGIANAHAVVVLEPDSLAQLDSLTLNQQTERYRLLNDAIDVYATLPAASVYLDGANCGWTSAPIIADRLLRAGVARARGFAVNVANYYRTDDEVARGGIISALTGGAHFVVDTSRNGRGPATGIANPWCNPPGRGLGPAPTTDTGDPRADAFLWIKTPGVSDGDCGRGDPPAGSWWQRRAEDLIHNAS